MRTWNIGGEGQLYMGAVGASAVGLVLGDWPRPLLIIAMIVGGALAGMLWACIPALLRAYLRTNEILTSLMLNYVAGFFMYYLIYDSSSYWRDLTTPGATVFPTGKSLGANASWPGITIGSFTLPMGFILGVGLAVGLLVLIRSTRYGFEMRVMGDSPQAANYSGIRTKRKIVSVMAISGGIAGIAGSSQIGDFGHVLDPRGLEQAQYGYTGIVVAALALYNPLAVVLGVAAHRRPHERWFRPGRPLLPDRPRGHHGGDHPVHRARRRDPGPLSDRAASPRRFTGVSATASIGTEVAS